MFQVRLLYCQVGCEVHNSRKLEAAAIHPAPYLSRDLVISFQSCHYIFKSEDAETLFLFLSSFLEPRNPFNDSSAFHSFKQFDYCYYSTILLSYEEWSPFTAQTLFWISANAWLYSPMCTPKWNMHVCSALYNCKCFFSPFGEHRVAFISSCLATLFFEIGTKKASLSSNLYIVAQMYFKYYNLGDSVAGSGEQRMHSVRAEEERESAAISCSAMC